MARPNKVGGTLKPIAQKPFACGGKMKACGGNLKSKGGKLNTKKKCRCK